jgi:hypothetical protein
MPVLSYQLWLAASSAIGPCRSCRCPAELDAAFAVDTSRPHESTEIVLETHILCKQTICLLESLMCSGNDVQGSAGKFRLQVPIATSNHDL